MKKVLLYFLTLIVIPTTLFADDKKETLHFAYNIPSMTNIAAQCFGISAAKYPLYLSDG